MAAWEKLEIGFRIVKDHEELGDIFETICLESRYQNLTNPSPNSKPKKKRQFI